MAESFMIGALVAFFLGCARYARIGIIESSDSRILLVVASLHHHRRRFFGPFLSSASFAVRYLNTASSAKEISEKYRP